MIKVFKFEVSNYTYGYKKKPERNVCSEEDIERTLNEFLEDKKLISLHTNTIDVHYHNNGNSNLIELIYTIVYENK